MLRRINISLALIILICFFLPWEQVSCGGAGDSLSGFDLARHGHLSFWVIPLMMLAVLVFGLVRHRTARAQAFGLLAVVSAAVAAYLMNDERTQVHDVSGVVLARLTGWFWLALYSALAMIVGSIALIIRRDRPPS